MLPQHEPGISPISPETIFFPPVTIGSETLEPIGLMRKNLKNNQTYYDSVQEVTDHENILGNRRPAAAPLVSRMGMEASVGLLPCFHSRLKCQPLSSTLKR